MGEEHVTFPCGSLSLEGVWHFSQRIPPCPAVVVCHPHPLYGGDMSNNIVLAICQALVSKGIAAFRFNFRGVGRSEGSFGGGIGEQEDACAALDFISANEGVNTKFLGLSGYSFGGGVALSVALKDERVKALGLVSPGLSPSGWESLGAYRGAKFVLLGGRDSFIRLAEIQPVIGRVLKPGEYQIISEADHFWWGFEKEIAGKIASFFADSLV